MADDNYPRRDSSSRRPVAPRGSHNRPWQAEDEYIKTIRRNSGDDERRSATRVPSLPRLAAPAPSPANANDSYARYLQQKQREREDLLEQSRQSRQRHAVFTSSSSNSSSAAVASVGSDQAIMRPRSQSPKKPSQIRAEERRKSHADVQQRLEQPTSAVRASSERGQRSSERQRSTSGPTERRSTERVSGSERRSTERRSTERVRSSERVRSTERTSSDRRRSSRRSDKDSESSGENQVSSRELRARRLRDEQHDRRQSNPTEVVVPVQQSAMTSAARSTTLREQSAAGRESLSLAAQKAASAPPPPPPLPALDQPRPRPMAAPARAVPQAPGDEVAKTHDDNVKGWSTMSNRRRSSAAQAKAALQSVGSALDETKVNAYFAGRTSLSRKEPASAVSSGDESSSHNRMGPTSSFDFTSDDSSEDGSASSYSDDDESIDETVPEWSVKVCIVSAVDFPANVVPNLPLAPVLRVALVSVGDGDENPQQDLTDESHDRHAVLAQMARGGLLSVPKAKVRATSAKILAKRDNGAVEFHEEMRWDGVRHPQRLALAVELSSRAVMNPTNIKESPPSQKAETPRFGSLGRGNARASPMASASDTGSDASVGGIGSLFRRPSSKKGKSEMEQAHAAAAVAKLLVEGGSHHSKRDVAEPSAGPLVDSKQTTLSTLSGNQSEVNVKLRPRKRRRNMKMTDDLYIGSKIIPLSKLPIQKAMDGKETARIEQWFELENAASAPSSPQNGPPSAGAKRNPSVLLELSFARAEVLDDSEDELDEDETVEKMKASFSKRASLKIRSQLKEESVVKEAPVAEEPELEPGVIDYVCVVGARDIGDQKADDGSSGWVNTMPECCVLEQFPPTDEYHHRNGRPVTLPSKVEWFCFPEGCRLWRGTTPPNLDELNLKRFSASSPANIATSIASFDACLGCTTSFSWFVFASNSEEYGSESMKTYGAVIRFFVPAPMGIDPTQDDFAQTLIEGPSSCDFLEGKRLWVPMGICVTSSIPIIGTMEAMLLRLCEAFVAKGVASSEHVKAQCRQIHLDLASLVFSYQRPIAGVVHCSVPFLKGEPFHLRLPPRGGLPPLPHGNAVASVCRLLGADGLNFLLAALLTECKILIHSDEIANLCLVAEVMTALLYPFMWSLPYIPVLPVEMMEFIEAPLSYLLGVPTCNMKHIDPSLLEDVVVIDLDKDFISSEFYEGAVNGVKSKTPTPLPASVASNISKAVYRLLRAEEDREDVSSGANFGPGVRSFPRMEPESQAEREFRVALTMEIGGLVRGYQECLVYASSSHPVFNVDRFLQIAPALFEEQRGASGQGENVSQFVLSPRSRRFMSLLVNCQHFHQFLECLESEHVAFFHEAVAAVNTNNMARRASKRTGHVLSLDFHKTMESLCDFLQKMEDKVPTYRVKRVLPFDDEGSNDWDTYESTIGARFPRDLLQQIQVAGEQPSNPNDSIASSEQGEGVRHVSIEYLMELEKNPWRYQSSFSVSLDDEAGQSLVLNQRKVTLREAIGERRYRAWKLALEQEKFDVDETSVLSDDEKHGKESFDLKSLFTAATADLSSTSSDTSGGSDSRLSSSQKRIADAKDREVLRRCLEKALSSSKSSADTTKTQGRDLLAQAEAALRNPSARRFLLSVLGKRSAQQAEASSPGERRKSSVSGTSKLDANAFDNLLRLGCAMLDACMEAKDYDAAYSMLRLTAGIYTITGDSDNDVAVSYMTGRMGLHPIYADLGVWERAKELHLVARKESKQDDAATLVDASESALDEGDAVEDDEYEAAVATIYEMLGYSIPAEELARFASRVSEQNGWFESERGQSLMLLARRLSVRKESTGAPSPTKKSDIELMRSAIEPGGAMIPVSGSNDGDRSRRRTLAAPAALLSDGELKWIETGWCHPAAQSSRRLAGNSTETTRRPGTQSLLNMLDEQKALPDVSKRQNLKHMKRSAITSTAYLGSSVVVTGGLDGGVFMARRVKSVAAIELDGADRYGVHGVHLDWGSSGSRASIGAASNSLDGEYGVGAVACLAATSGARSSYSSLRSVTGRSTKDTSEPLDEEELLEAMDGCRVVAGTTCGDLRVWLIKDVFSAVFYSNTDESAKRDDSRLIHRAGEGVTSSYANSRRKGATDFAAGSSLTRLRFSLRGRALSGHRGGVSCIDVPSNVYRPDCIISGGADGLIKLWSLRSPGTAVGRRDSDHMMNVKGGEALSPRTKTPQSGDALSILSGHGGRILCIKTAWHGDRLLSGGADRTVRIWDLAGSGGKCLHSLSGHFGWVTHVQYWGPNTIISASTDRSIALWDARVRSSPLFSLRHHYAPVSDLLVGSRTDPILVSAASDGTVAAWDFRRLSGGDDKASKKTQCKTVRNPPGRLYLHDYSRRRHVCGSVLLSRGPNRKRKTASCIGSDAIVREWDYQTGEVISEHVTGHCDLVSSFTALQGDGVYDAQLESSGPVTGSITTSWDGTVRMRSLVKK